MPTKAATRVYATDRFNYMADALCAEAPKRFVRGELETKHFPNGETRLEILDPERARDAEIILIGGTEKEDLFDLLMYAGELAPLADRLNILIPFFRYATQERRDKGHSGHIVIAKGIARALSALPTAARGNRIILVDPHTNSLAQYFDDTRVRTEIIRCAPLVADIVKTRIPGKLNEKVICSVDDGRTDWVMDVASTLNRPFALLSKERVSGTETRVLGAINGNVKGRIAILVDDMARTLGSALGAADAYLAAGAKEVWLVTTHPDYAPSALTRAHSTGTIRGVITTDTYPSYTYADSEFGSVVPIAPFLAATLSERFGM